MGRKSNTKEFGTMDKTKKPETKKQPQKPISAKPAGSSSATAKPSSQTSTKR